MIVTAVRKRVPRRTQEVREKLAQSVPARESVALKDESQLGDLLAALSRVHLDERQMVAEGGRQAGVIGGTDDQGVNQSILGVPVLLDGSIPTNLGGGTEDVIIGITADELHVWDERGPLFIGAEQLLGANPAVRFVLYG